MADPVDNRSVRLATIDLGALTAPAKEALESLPALTVAADATFTIETAPVTVTPAPEPEPPPPPPPVERTRSTSRDRERTPAPARERSVRQSNDDDEARALQESEAEDSVERVTKRSVPASAAGSAAVSIAARYVGVPYVYGGSTPDGFDCSGFTSYVYRQLGIELPRTSSGQGSIGTRVSRDEARPGDIVWTPGHVAIYAGDGMIIDAPRPGKVVQFRKMWHSNPRFIRVG